MSTDLSQNDLLADRLRDVGFSERAVTLILEQVLSVSDRAGLAESHPAPFERPLMVADRHPAEVHAAGSHPAEVQEHESEHEGIGVPVARATDEEESANPDLALGGAGLLGWLIVLASSWSGLTCENRLLGVGDVEIVASGCAAAAPNLLGPAGFLTALWLISPALWHAVSGRLGVQPLSLTQAQRATTIWAGFAALMSLTLILASLG